MTHNPQPAPRVPRPLVVLALTLILLFALAGTAMAANYTLDGATPTYSGHGPFSYNSTEKWYKFDSSAQIGAGDTVTLTNGAKVVLMTGDTAIVDGAIKVSGGCTLELFAGSTVMLNGAVALEDGAKLGCYGLIASEDAGTIFVHGAASLYGGSAATIESNVQVRANATLIYASPSGEFYGSIGLGDGAAVVSKTLIGILHFERVELMNGGDEWYLYADDGYALSNLPLEAIFGSDLGNIVWVDEDGVAHDTVTEAMLDAHTVLTASTSSLEILRDGIAVTEDTIRFGETVTYSYDESAYTGAPAWEVMGDCVAIDGNGAVTIADGAAVGDEATVTLTVGDDSASVTVTVAKAQPSILGESTLIIGSGDASVIVPIQQLGFYYGDASELTGLILWVTVDQTSYVPVGSVALGKDDATIEIQRGNLDDALAALTGFEGACQLFISWPDGDAYNEDISYTNIADLTIEDPSIQKATPVVSGNAMVTFVKGVDTQVRVPFTMTGYTAMPGTRLKTGLYIDLEGDGTDLSNALGVAFVDTTDASVTSFAHMIIDFGNGDPLGIITLLDAGFIEMNKAYDLYVGVLDGNEYNTETADTKIGTITVVNPAPYIPPTPSQSQPQPIDVQPEAPVTVSGDGNVAGTIEFRGVVGTTLKARVFLRNEAGETVIEVPDLPVVPTPQQPKAEGQLATVQYQLPKDKVAALPEGKYTLWVDSPGNSDNLPVPPTQFGVLIIDRKPVIGNVSMPKKFRATVGFDYQLVTLIDGDTMPAFTTIGSKKPKIAELSDMGVLTAKKAGKAVVQYKLNGKTTKCTVTVVKNKLGWQKAVKAPKGGIALSTARMFYEKGYLHLDVWVSNRAKQTLVSVPGLKYELYDKQGNILLSVPFDLVKPAKPGKNQYECLHVTEEMLPGVDKQLFDLANGGLRCTIVGWEDAVQSGKAVFTDDIPDDEPKEAPATVDEILSLD